MKLLTPERLLFILFPLSLLIDLVNGFTQVQMGIQLPIGILYRGAVFLMLVYYLPGLHSQSWKVYLAMLCIMFLLGCVYWGTGISISYATEVDNFVRIFYLYLMIALFDVKSKDYPTPVLMRTVANYGFVIGCCIIFSFITGWGNFSYNAEYGFGTKSYFKAGNDLGMVLLFSSCYASFVMFRRMDMVSLLRFAVIIVGCVLVGTRVCIVGAAMVTISAFIYFLVAFRPQGVKRRIRRMVVLVLGVPFLIIASYFFILSVYSMMDDYALNRFSIESISTARDVLTESARSHISSFEGGAYVLGRGCYSLFSSVAVDVVAGREQRMIEADLYEIIGCYGYLFGGLILLPVVMLAAKSIVFFFRRRTYVGFGLMFVFCAFVFISFTAGHGMKNTMLPPLYAVSVLLFKRLRYENFAD